MAGKEIKFLTDERLTGLMRRCVKCGRSMASTGKARLDPGARWAVEFYCEKDAEVPVWAPELQALLDEVTQGADAAGLTKK